MKWNLSAVALFTVIASVPCAAQDDERLPSIHRLNPASLQSGKADLCVFCHTPLGNRQFKLEQPGWENLPTNPEGVYPAVSLMTTRLDESNAGNISVVCQSCHDGAQAPDADNPIPPVPGAEPASPDTLGAERLRALSHPPGGYSGSHPVVTFNRAQRSFVNDVPVWWIETGTPGRQKDDIQLYTRLSNGVDEPTPYVECSSCHDPHGTQQYLLRMEMSRSELCTGCHSL